MKPKISVVIRVLNEARSLEALLKCLKAQKGIAEEAVEIIVVDNESTDGTQEVAREFGATLLTIPRDSFTYPSATNKGVALATAPLVVLVSAHSLPLHDHWLISFFKHFEDPQVVGVFGMALPNARCGPFEWLGHEISYAIACLANPKKITSMRMGTFTARNCVIRREIWEMHHFDERFQLGGEDVQWARWAFTQGYAVVRDVAFTVRHSHGVPLRGYLAQLKLGISMKGPTVFTREALEHREDMHW